MKGLNWDEISVCNVAEVEPASTWEFVACQILHTNKFWGKHIVVYAGSECNRKSFVRHPVMLYCCGCSSAWEEAMRLV